jgi:large subunit ribosomal protein L25
MAMAEIVLNIETRERIGTGGARDARRSGLVPGVLYGGKEAPVAVTVKANEFRKALHTGKLLGHLVTLSHGGKTQPAIAKAIDMHPVTDEPTHFDLYRVDAHQQIKIAVPLHFRHQDDSPGLKRGGSLNVVFHDVLLACHADQIPEEIVVDLTGMDIGATIHVSDLKLPKGVEAAIDGATVLAAIAGASAQANADEAADEAASVEAAATASEEAGEA